MTPFKKFFVMAIGIMLLFFVAKVVFVAFVAAAIMSVLYAVYRRVRDFITYDRYGESYIPAYNNRSLYSNRNSGVEPLFYGDTPKNSRKTVHNVRFIKAI